MSKKDKDAAFASFLAECVATVPDEQRAAVEGVFANDAVKGRLRDGWMAREDYSRSKDELSATQAELTTRRAALEAWYTDANAQLAASKGTIDQYKAQYGEIDPAKPAPKYLTPEQFNEALGTELAHRDAAAIDVADILTDLKIDHRDVYKEALDSKALIKYATDNRLPLRTAYTQFTADKADAKRKSEFDAALKTAREEGAKEYAASHNLPTISTPAEPYSFEAPAAQVHKSSPDRIAAAVAAHNASRAA